MRTIIKFGAEWCQPCKRIAPVLAAAAERNTDTTYMDVDVDEIGPQIVSEWGVVGVPTIVVLEDGEEVARATGPASVNLLR